MVYRRTLWDRVLMASATTSVTAILGAAVLIWVSLWWPYVPLTRLELSVTSPARVGGELQVQMDYCKTDSRWVPREVRWTLVNDVIVSIDGPRAALPAGCDGARPMAIQLSDHIAPGRYRLQADVIYQPWPWREIVYTRRSPPFQIVSTEAPMR